MNPAVQKSTMLGDEVDEGVAAKRRKLDDSLEERDKTETPNEVNLHEDEDNNLQEQLRQFDVLDEVQGDESGTDESAGKDSKENTEILFIRKFTHLLFDGFFFIQISTRATRMWMILTLRICWMKICRTICVNAKRRINTKRNTRQYYKVN